MLELCAHCDGNKSWGCQDMPCPESKAPHGISALCKESLKGDTLTLLYEDTRKLESSQTSHLLVPLGQASQSLELRTVHSYSS